MINSISQIKKYEWKDDSSLLTDGYVMVTHSKRRTTEGNTSIHINVMLYNKDAVATCDELNIHDYQVKLILLKMMNNVLCREAIRSYIINAVVDILRRKPAEELCNIVCYEEVLECISECHFAISKYVEMSIEPDALAYLIKVYDGNLIEVGRMADVLSEILKMMDSDKEYVNLPNDGNKWVL